TGMVTFDLKGQSWEVVLQWLADASHLSLDWQELPGDTLNLTTTRSYTLEEARDIVNRHLLLRDYSLVQNGELLSVMKLSDIKMSLVPRVEPDELDGQLDHTLCKVSFDLNWLIADEAVEEFAPLLSKAGKINKLSRTNRLEVMDTAASLKEMYRILQTEQSDTGQEQLVRTFRLEHRRANEVIELLRTLLGLEDESGGGDGGRGMGDTGQVMSMMRQMQQQLQQMGNSGPKGGGGGKAEPAKTRLVLNMRENMILATAAPDQMAIIEKAIEQIDVPLDAGNSLIQNVSRMKVYRLDTVDAQTLVDLLQELGDLDPGTVLKVDSDKKSIIAWASLADHLTITTLVERLDSSGRAVEVITLRRLDAEYVAGTIQALMAPPPKENNNSRYSYYSRYSFNEPQQEEQRSFKVEADIENNRLLVFANKVEMDEIRLLLQKLGEIPDPDAHDNGFRVFELGPDEDPQDVMRRLKNLWKRSNSLEVGPLPQPPNTDEDGQNSESRETTDDTAKSLPTVSESSTDDASGDGNTLPDAANVETAESAVHRKSTAEEFFAGLTNSTSQHGSRSSVLTALDESDAEPPSRSGSPEPEIPGQAERLRDLMSARSGRSGGNSADEPVRFSFTPDGRLLITSNDTAALNEVEDLMKEIVRPLPNYRIFYLKYATPSWVTLNLEDYFKAEEQTESGMRYDPWWGYVPSERKVSGNHSLSRRRQPQFIYDNFTSTILVRDADRRQMQIIEDLIKVYDVPEPADTRSMRVTKIFRLQNSKAEIVAQAVKDVFRDLLSANDKALEKENQQQQQTRVYSYFGGGEEDGDDESPIRFKGLLSVGVDPNSDTLVISSTAALMETVSELVTELDRAAETSSSVQVVKLDNSVDALLLQERLRKALGISDDSADRKNRNGKDTGDGVPVGAKPGSNERGGQN
ncbi:MAG: hypothetical protein KDA89_20675, partial [Planctomycetaceae bacterium]|nr:hypothetical protein [Planctomycetaceae bacterium]